MKDFRKSIYRSDNDNVAPPIGIEVNALRGNQSCLGGICTLNDSVINITIYTSDGDMNEGQTVYSDASLATVYLTNNIIKKDDGIVLYSVDSNGILGQICITDEGC